MLELITYKPAFGEPSASPFCVKTMCLLQMSGLDWTPDFDFDPRKAPMSKLPVLRDGAQIIADSNAIEQYLTENYDIRFGPQLTPQQNALGHSLKRMVEEHLYFAMVLDRWGNDANWSEVVPAYFSDIPAVIRGIITGSLRKQAKKGLNWMGISRYSEAHQVNRIGQDLDAIIGQLGDKPFLFGETATSFDAAIAPQLSALAVSPAKSSLSQTVCEREPLVDYIARFQKSYYPQILETETVSRSSTMQEFRLVQQTEV